MTRREEIKQYCIEQGFPQGACSSILEVKAIVATEAIKWADKTMIERLRELKCVYEKDLDAEPRIYERDIQLCAKISLIERLIIELKEE